MIRRYFLPTSLLDRLNRILRRNTAPGNSSRDGIAVGVGGRRDLACSVQALDRAAVSTDSLRLFILAQTAMTDAGEERGLDRIERPLSDRHEHLRTAKLSVILRSDNFAVPLFNRCGQARSVDASLLSQFLKRVCHNHMRSFRRLRRKAHHFHGRVIIDAIEIVCSLFAIELNQIVADRLVMGLRGTLFIHKALAVKSHENVVHIRILIARVIIHTQIALQLINIAGHSADLRRHDQTVAGTARHQAGLEHGIGRMQGYFNNTRFNLGSYIRLPHFYMHGSFDAKTGSVPEVGVRWYDKGGIFSRPSIIGVGEKRPEFVGALDDLREIVREESNTANITLNVYGSEGQNVRELANIVIDRIRNSIDRQEAAFA